MTTQQPTDLESICEAHYGFLSLWPGYVREAWAGASFIGNRLIGMPFRNHVALVRSQPDDVPALIERANSFYRAIGTLPAFQLDRMTTPATLPEWLVEAGYIKQAEEVWMLCPVDEAAAPVTPPNYITIEQLTPTSPSPAPLIQAYIDCFNTSFGVASYIQAGFGDSFRHLLPHPAGLHFVALLDGQAAGAITLIHEAGLGGVYNVGTFPAMRGQGVATTLLLHILHVARQLGVKQLFLQTRHHGQAQPIYERVGYRTHFIRDWYSPAAPKGIWSE